MRPEVVDRQCDLHNHDSDARWVTVKSCHTNGSMGLRGLDCFVVEPNNKPAQSRSEVALGTVPAVMRFSAVVVLVQCAAMFIYAASLIVSQFTGHTLSLIHI